MQDEGLRMQPLGHEVAFMVYEAATAIKLNCGIAVGHLQVEELRAVLERGPLGQLQQLRTDSLPSMRRLHEEFVDPGALAAIFQAVIEANCEIGDGLAAVRDQVDKPVEGIGQKLGKTRANRSFEEWLGPRIAALHLAHQGEYGFEVKQNCLRDAKGHEGGFFLQNVNGTLEYRKRKSKFFNLNAT